MKIVLLRRKRAKNGKIWYLLFGFLPIFAVRVKPRAGRFYLFGILPILKLSYGKPPAEAEQAVRDDYYEMLKSDIADKHVLLIEGQAYACHAEFLYGYAKYFLDMGRNVDIVLTPEHFERKPLSGFDLAGGRVRVFSIDLKTPAGRANLAGQLVNYELALLATSNYTFVDFDFFYHVYAESMNKSNFYFISHSFDEYKKSLSNPAWNAAKREYYKEHALSAMPFAKDMRFLACLDTFADARHEELRRDGITRFISVGGITRVNKDYDLLFDAIRALAAKGVRGFRVDIMGGGPTYLDEFDTHGCEPYVNFMARVNYPEMYRRMRDADFLLPLLSEDKQKEYLDDRPTGSYNLSMMFLKPMVMNKTFAKEYGISGGACVGYDGTGLAAAMESACKISESSYVGMVGELAKTKAAHYSRGLDSTKLLLERRGGARSDSPKFVQRLTRKNPAAA
ncbi:MAG: hypothetical protein LBL52_03030 [Rickettsiales bacterium]|nr:hypothetical protein [Rickettsiales bacterium]